MLFTNKDLLRLTVPILLQNVLATVVRMIDSLMVAGIGEAAVSGVSLINSLDVVLITFFSSMAVGGTVIVSQFLGRGSTEKTKDAVKQLVYVTAAAALLLLENPDLTPEQVCQRLFDGAVDVNAPGWDPASGWGILSTES